MLSILLSIFATATICIPIAVTYGRMIESHRWDFEVMR